MFGQDNPSELQQDILDTARRNPDAGPSEIASICDCSESYVRETLNEYGRPSDPFGGGGGGLL